MSMDLKTVEYVVFDEADRYPFYHLFLKDAIVFRLFEMGFAAQLHEILHRLPSSRQTSLFSATLPQVLVDFAKAGLINPILIRLDVDAKISEDLEMLFFFIRQEDKLAALLYLLRDIIHLSSSSTSASNKFTHGKGEGHFKDHQTVVFCSTRHHVEHISAILAKAGYAVSYVYGQLDQVARRQQIETFRKGNAELLVVTDVAARGIDIPILENVVNYDFCPGSKIFVHRVGRVARAGRPGKAYSLITRDDLPYLLDLSLFLGKSIALPYVTQTGYDKDEMILGKMPAELLEMDVEWIRNRMVEDTDLVVFKMAFSFAMS